MAAKTYARCYIEWVDSVVKTGSAWYDKEEVMALRPDVVRTYGWFVGEGEDHVTVAHSVGKDNESEVSGVICIPRQAIVAMTTYDVDSLVTPYEYGNP